MNDATLAAIIALRSLYSTKDLVYALETSEEEVSGVQSDFSSGWEHATVSMLHTLMNTHNIPEEELRSLLAISPHAPATDHYLEEAKKDPTGSSVDSRAFALGSLASKAFLMETLHNVTNGPLEMMDEIFRPDFDIEKELAIVEQMQAVAGGDECLLDRLECLTGILGETAVERLKERSAQAMIMEILSRLEPEEKKNMIGMITKILKAPVEQRNDVLQSIRQEWIDKGLKTEDVQWPTWPNLEENV